MSKESVEAVIGKAVLDSEFREALFADPEEVLAGYELSEEESAVLRAIDFETMESFAGTLDERISKVSLMPLKLIDGVTSLQVGLSDALSGEMEPDAGDAAAGGTVRIGGSGGSVFLRK
jgi:hypothetical protein